MIRALLLARVLWLPAAAYGLSAVTHIGLLWLMLKPGRYWGPGVADNLTAWDGRLLLQIAQHGYPDSFTYTPDGKLTGNNLSFMPLYPALVSFVHDVTGLGFAWSGLVVSHLSFVALLAVVNSLFGLMYGRRMAAVATVLVACAQPMGLVFLMSYTESLFTALALGTLLAVFRRRWILSGVLASLAGLTRPTGVAVTVALAAGVLSYLVWRRRVAVRPLVGLALGCVGLPSYLAWVGLRVGPLNAWFTIQEAGWGTHWDNGHGVYRLLRDAFTQSDGWVMISTAVLITVIFTLTLGAWRSTWMPLAVYGVMVVVMTFGQSNYYHCKLRLLLPVVVLVVPVSLALAKARRTTVVTCIVLGTLFSSWYGAYMLTVWQYTI
jgi:hypothetical protein